MRLKPPKLDKAKKPDSGAKKQRFKLKNKEPKLVKYPALSLDKYLPESNSKKAKVAKKVYNNFPEKVGLYDHSYAEWLTKTLSEENLYLSPKYLDLINSTLISCRMDLVTFQVKNKIKNFSFPRELWGYPDKKRSWRLRRSWIICFEDAICTEEEYKKHNIERSLLLREIRRKEKENLEYIKKENRRNKTPSYKFPKKKS